MNRKLITRTHRDDTQCSRCGNTGRCLVLTMRDEDAGPEAGQSAFSVRTGETVAICDACITATRVWRTHARTRWGGAA